MEIPAKRTGEAIAGAPIDVLIVGIGNVLMGDEGIGVHVARRIQDHPLPAGVECLDGGTGGLSLLGPIGRAGRVILIDATVDGSPPGTVRRLRPRFSSDYPRTLTAHDIGLKDLLDAAYLLGERMDVTLYAVSIQALQEPGTELSPEFSSHVPRLAARVLAELAGIEP
jgi:hydrogenase maturation protease